MWQKVVKRKAIRTNLDGYLFLQMKGNEERRTKPYDRDAFKAHLVKNFNRLYPKGVCTLLDDDIGGCNGNPVNAWEERRWTSWSSAKMGEMLTAEGIWWETAPEQETIDIGL